MVAKGRVQMDVHKTTTESMQRVGDLRTIGDAFTLSALTISSCTSAEPVVGPPPLPPLPAEPAVVAVATPVRGPRRVGHRVNRKLKHLVHMSFNLATWLPCNSTFPEPLNKVPSLWPKSYEPVALLSGLVPYAPCPARHHRPQIQLKLSMHLQVSISHCCRFHRFRDKELAFAVPPHASVLREGVAICQW